jgi:hypothetical protein
MSSFFDTKVKESSYKTITKIKDLEHFGEYFILNHTTPLYNTSDKEENEDISEEILKTTKEKYETELENNFGNLYFATVLYYIIIQFLEDNNYIIRETYIPGKIVGMILEIVMEEYIHDKVRKMNIVDKIDLLVKLFYSLIYKEKIIKKEDNLIGTLPYLVKESLDILLKYQKENKESRLSETSIEKIDILLETKLELKPELQQILIKCCESLLTIKLFLSEVSYLDNMFHFDDDREIIFKVFFSNFLNIQGQIKLFLDNQDCFTLNKQFYKTVYKKTKLSKFKFIKIIKSLEKDIDVDIIILPFFQICCKYLENKNYLE